MATKEKASTKQKKKRWFQIIAPKQFNEAKVGDTTAYEASSLVGKCVTTSLMNLTRDIKKQNYNVRLKVTGIKDNKAITEIDDYQMVPSSIKRMVRRRKDRVDDSFVILTKDNVKVRIKPMILTRSNTNQSVLSSLRKFMKAYLFNKIKDMTYGEFVNLTVNDGFFREIKSNIAKIYPIRTFTIRAFKKENDAKAKVYKLSENEKALLESVMKAKKKAKEEALAKEDAKNAHEKSGSSEKKSDE
ncbi:MAG: hypothetical protein ACLFPQ_04200 [Candidatus Woesearchaeota archaeon]